MSSRPGLSTLCVAILVAAATDSVRPALAAPESTDDDPTVGEAVSNDASEPMSAWGDADIFSPFSLDYSGCAVASAPVVNEAYQQAVVELTNLERRAFGNLPPLRRSPTLDDSARFHSTDLGQDNYFDHDSYDRDGGGNLVWACGWSTRVQNFYGAYNNLGENIAAGYASPAAVMLGWMNSTGHKDNLMSTAVREIGVGYACCVGSYGRYWTQDFGRKAAVYPLVINGEAGTTTSTAVSLYLYGAWAEMRLRSDSDPWGAWQTFSNNVSWTLPGALGAHTVYAEMRSGATTTTANDSITLVNGAPTLTPTSMSTGSPTAGATSTVSATSTPAPVTATATATATRTSTATSTATNTATHTATTVPTSTTIPTNTATHTATTVPTSTTIPASTATRTATATATATNTASVTATATRTASPLPATFIAIHDGYTDSQRATQNFGTGRYLWSRGRGSRMRFAYFKFGVTGLTGAVRSATLRLYVSEGTAGGGYVYRSSNNLSDGTPWTERALTWRNQPTVIGSPLAAFNNLPASTSQDFDVTSAVAGNGTVSLQVRVASTDQAEFPSRESRMMEQRPRLIIVQAP